MLKSLVIAASVLTVLSPASEALEFVNVDGSKFSQLCIAAAQSKETYQREAQALNISSFQIGNIQCNGMNIETFANQYGDSENQETVKVFAFENADSKPESELCIAAAISNETYAETKARLFDNTVVRNVSCNGVKLTKFARRYNKSFNG